MVAILKVACTRCGYWDIIVGLITQLVLAPELCPGQRYRKALLHLLLGVQLWDLGQLVELSDQRGVDHCSGIASVGRLNQPPLNNCPDVELETHGHGVQEDRLVLRNCTEMQCRLNFNT